MFAVRKTLLASAFVAICATPAFAHPHVFAEARLEVEINADRTLKAPKRVWRFDDMFSSTVLVEFDANADLKLGESELQEVANVVFTSLSEYDYFQFVTRAGEDVAMKVPEELMATFEDNMLTIFFQSEPKEPLKLGGKIALGVYDPTFYTAIDFVEDDYMALQNMPAGCTRAFVRPDPDEAIAQNQATLDQSFWDTTTSNDLTKLFATRLEIDCEASG